MTPWLVRELRNLGLEVARLDAKHASAALEMQINKEALYGALPFFELRSDSRWLRSYKIEGGALSEVM